QARRARAHARGPLRARRDARARDRRRDAADPLARRGARRRGAAPVAQQPRGAAPARRAARRRRHARRRARRAARRLARPARRRGRRRAPARGDGQARPRQDRRQARIPIGARMSAEILAFPSGGTSDRVGGSPDRPDRAGGSPEAEVPGARHRAGAPAPVLVGCSHGTDDPAGREVIRALLDDVRAARPDLDVREAFVDVQQPEVADVVTAVVTPAAGARDPEGGADAARPGDTDPGAGVARPGDAVVVPLLLSAGFHVAVDVAAAVEDRGPGTGSAAAATPLGPDPRLVALLADRLAEAGVRPDDAVVVA